MESAYENGVYYRNPVEILRRANNYLMTRSDDPVSEDDRMACKVLREIYFKYFSGSH